MKISLDKEHRNDFVPAVAVLSVVMMGLFCGIIYVAQKYQEKQESAERQENKIVNVKNTFNALNMFEQKQR